MANPNLFVFAGSFICPKVGRKGFFEHQGNAFSHDTDRVDGVDQRVCPRVEEIALEKFHH
jgi:hypothetical protein